MKKIKLTQGKFAIVDDADFEWLNQWKWCFNKGYAVRTIYLEKINRKWKIKKISMHRLIINTPDSMETDHIDNNKLNNQRQNLRIATSSQNKFNMPKSPNNTSGYKGVNWSKDHKKWRVAMQINKEFIHVGYFLNKNDAYKAYLKATKIYQRNFSFLCL